MKLIDYRHEYDYGHDFYLTLGRFKYFNVLDAIMHTSEYWSWHPNIRLTIALFNGNIASVELHFWSVSMYLHLIPYRNYAI